MGRKRFELPRRYAMTTRKLMLAVAAIAFLFTTGRWLAGLEYDRSIMVMHHGAININIVTTRTYGDWLLGRKLGPMPGSWQGKTRGQH